MELHSTTVGANVELVKARKGFEAANLAAEKADPKKPQLPLVRTVLFDQGVAHAQQIEIFNEGGADKIAALNDELGMPLNFKRKEDKQKQTIKECSEVDVFQ